MTFVSICSFWNIPFIKTELFGGNSQYRRTFAEYDNRFRSNFAAAKSIAD